jgi:hypothetical protein
LAPFLFFTVLMQNDLMKRISTSTNILILVKVKIHKRLTIAWFFLYWRHFFKERANCYWRANLWFGYIKHWTTSSQLLR